MRTTRTAAAAAAFLLTASLAACGSDAGGDPNVLTISSITNEKPGLDAVVPKFEAANPGVKVRVTTAGVDQYQTTIRTQLSSGTAPDVLFVWPGDGNPVALKVVAGADYLTDLSDKPWVGDIPPGIQPVTLLDGKSWIAPASFSGIGAVYNMTAVRAAGLTPPTTWSELKAFCAAAKAKGTAAFALGGQTNWVTQLINYALTPTLVYGPNPRFAEEMSQKQATFAESPWAEAMTKYLEMQEEGCFQDDPLGTDYEASLDLVAKGTALGVVQVQSAIAAIKQAAPTAELSMLPLPAGDDPARTRMAGAAGGGYGVNAKAENKDLAMRFIDFLMTPEHNNTYAEASASMPAIPNDRFTPDPALTTLLQYQKEGRTDPYMDQLWPNARVQQTHFAVVQELLSGSTTVPEALAKMDEAYDRGA